MTGRQTHSRSTTTPTCIVTERRNEADLLGDPEVCLEVLT